jgi:hypothetical protein
VRDYQPPHSCLTARLDLLPRSENLDGGQRIPVRLGLTRRARCSVEPALLLCAEMIARDESLRASREKIRAEKVNEIKRGGRRGRF